MTMTEPLPQAVLPEHLTDALRRSGVLGVNTCVSEATVESSRATILSRIIRLRLRYDGLSENAPPTVILKTGLPERAGGGWNAGRQEVAFYQRLPAPSHRQRRRAVSRRIGTLKARLGTCSWKTSPILI